MFHTIFCQNMPMPPKVNFMKNILKDHILRTIYVCLMPKLVTRCTIYDIRSLKNQIWPILVHIYPLFILIYMSNMDAIWWELLELKYKLWKKRYCFRCHGGPLHKIQWYRGTKMSANADLITLETYVQQGEQLTTSFSYMGQNMNTNLHFLLFRGPWGTFNDHTGPILLSRYPLTHSYK